MKRITTLLFLLVASLSIQAQVDISAIKSVYQSDFTPQFMGIPVDGTKADMIDAIKAKGFKYDQEYGFFTGDFNGKSVRVFIHTNHDVVDRIMVSYPSVSEGQIKTEYNSLLRQFQKSTKYNELIENETISESEDISYEMTVHHKDYESVFFYLPTTISIPALSKATKELIVAIKNGENIEELEELNEYLNLDAFNDIKDTNDDEWEAFMNLSKEDWEDAVKLIFFGEERPNSIWFCINEYYGEYSINIYYDNEANRPNGEDL